MAFQCDNDWQLTKKTVLERNSHMFNNPFMSDIKFTCGESKRKYFYAHKYVLATSSVVFHAMFYGDLAETGSTVHLPDTDEESFEVFLRPLYTDDYKMTTEMAIKVMYLANKYMVSSLIEKCVDVFQENLQPDNVVTILELALYFEEKKLEKKCWKVVESYADKVFASEAFCHISRDTLIDIMGRKTNTSEIELSVKAVLKWTNAQCAENGIEASGKNRRAVMGESLYQQCVSLSGLLTTAAPMNCLESADLKWKQPAIEYQPRPKRFKRCNLGDVGAPGVLWGYHRNSSDFLSFSVDKPATFHGVYLFGDNKGSEYEVSLRVDGAKVTGTYTSECNGEGVYGYNVMLPTSISVEEHKVVTMAARIRGPKSYFVKKGKGEVEHEGVHVTFGNWRYGPTNGTDKTGGQFYEVILSMRGVR